MPNVGAVAQLEHANRLPHMPLQTIDQEIAAATGEGLPSADAEQLRELVAEFLAYHLFYFPKESPKSSENRMVHMGRGSRQITPESTHEEYSRWLAETVDGDTRVCNWVWHRASEECENWNIAGHGLHHVAVSYMCRTNQNAYISWLTRKLGEPRDEDIRQVALQTFYAKYLHCRAIKRFPLDSAVAFIRTCEKRRAVESIRKVTAQRRLIKQLRELATLSSVAELEQISDDPDPEALRQRLRNLIARILARPETVPATWQRLIPGLLGYAYSREEIEFWLKDATSVQRARGLLFHYSGFTVAEIASLSCVAKRRRASDTDHVAPSAISQSLKQVWTILQPILSQQLTTDSCVHGFLSKQLKETPS